MAALIYFLVVHLIVVLSFWFFLSLVQSYSLMRGVGGVCIWLEHAGHWLEYGTGYVALYVQAGRMSCRSFTSLRSSGLAGHSSTTQSTIHIHTLTRRGQHTRTRYGPGRTQPSQVSLPRSVFSWLVRATERAPAQENHEQFDRWAAAVPGRCVWPASRRRRHPPGSTPGHRPLDVHISVVPPGCAYTELGASPDGEKNASTESAAHRGAAAHECRARGRVQSTHTIEAQANASLPKINGRA